MREIDRLTTDRFGVPSLTLMENAAAAVARAVVNALSGTVASRSVLIFCGKGNNGGDGAAAGRLLAMTGVRVDLVLIGRIEETKGDARVNFDLAKTWNKAEARASATTESGLINLFECDSEKGWEQLLASVLDAPHDAIVDALFGTGLTRPVEGLHRQAIDYINHQRSTRDAPPHSTCPIISVDIPSGLNSDSEQPIGATVQADVTVTMTAPKRANVVPPPSHFNGRLIVAETGSPRESLDEVNSDLFLTEEDDARRWLIETRYTPESYKNTHGHALII